jgi:hypothetical protein
MSTEETGAPLPHLGPEFYSWLWYASEAEGGTMSLEEEVGVVDVWVDERLAFQAPGEAKTRALMTGENTSTSPEAMAALASGKVVRDVQLHIRHGDHEFQLTLRGSQMDVSGLKLPPHSSDGEEELLYERMYLYEELWFVMGALYRRFAGLRTSEAWAEETLPAMRTWVQTGQA